DSASEGVLPHGIRLAKSSTSNRRECIAYRELVLERLRLVPKGQWILAGGANHRFVVKIESEPRPGLRKSRDDHSVAPSVLAAYCVRDRWLAPPANVHDASGVRSATQPPA